MNSTLNKTVKRLEQIKHRLEVCMDQKETCHLFLSIALFFSFAFAVSGRNQESNLFVEAQQALHACSSGLTRGVERARLVSKRFSCIFQPIPLLLARNRRERGDFVTPVFWRV